MTFFAKKAGNKRYQSLTNVLLDIEGTIVETTDGGPIGPGGGGVTTIQDEGMTVENAATTLNFTGAGVTASQTSPGVVEVVIPGGAGVTDAINLASTPPGAPVFQQNNGGVLEFNVLVAGSGLGLLVSPGVIEIESVVIGNNVGGGAEVYQGNTGANLDFRTIVAGANVTVTQNADTIEIAAAVGSGGPEPVTDLTIPAVPQVGYDEITLVLPQRAVDQDFTGSPTPLRLSLPAINIPADEGRRLGLVLSGGNPTRDLQVRTLDNFVGPTGEPYTPGIWTFAVVGDIPGYTTLNWEAADGALAFVPPPGQITSIAPDSIVQADLPVNVVVTGTGGTLPALADILVFFSLSQNDPPVPAVVTVNVANQPGGPNTPWIIDLTITSIDPIPPGAQPYSVIIVDNSLGSVFAELHQAFAVDLPGPVTPFQPSPNVWICDWNVQDGGAAPGGDLFRFSVGPAGTNAVFTGPDALADALAAAGAAAAIEGQAIVVILPGSYSTPGGGWTIPRNVQVTGFAARRSLVRLFGSVTFANQGNNLPPNNTQSLSHVTIEVDVTNPGGSSPDAFGIFMEPRFGAEIGGTPSGDRTLWDVELLQVGVRAPAPQVAILLSGYHINVRECAFTVVDPTGPATNIGVSVQEGPLSMSDTTVEMTNIDQDVLNFGFGPTVNGVVLTDCSLVGHIQFTPPAGSGAREFTFSKVRAGGLRSAITVSGPNGDDNPRFVKNEIVSTFSPQIIADDNIVAIDNVIDSAPGLAEILTLGISRVQAQTTQEQTVIARRALTARGGFSRRGISTDVHASGFFTFVGDAQVVRYVLTAETLGAVPTVLLNDGQQVDPVPIGNNRLYRVLVTARAAGLPTNSYFAEATFSVARDAGPAVQLVAPILPVSLFNGLPPGVGLSGTLSFGPNQEPRFIVTGALATTIRWVASVEVLELQEP